MGNIRDYNEDTITATKIIFNNDNKNVNNFYFFGVFDGHGGSGCSLYLKENLHKFISNFSKEAIKEAINNTEEKFLKEWYIKIILFFFVQKTTSLTQM